jgi:hypothetical protein
MAKKKSQFKIVMDTFGRGRLRSSSGKKVTSPKQAVAIAYSEQRAARSKGRSVRTWHGRTRIRPNK